jgi:sugar O-acyltransferase (sialic acid O-acetyltransferase NeuD family)
VTKQPKAIYVIGAGGHGKVAIRAAQLSGIKVVAVFDDAPDKAGMQTCGVQVVGCIDSIQGMPPLPTHIAIGENRLRMQIASSLELSWATIIHPAAFLDESVSIGVGALVLAGAVVQVDAVLGEHVIINDNATIEHDCRVGVGAHVSCNACLAGGVGVGDGTLVGVGASVLPGVQVGDFSIVGAGAVVTSNLQDNVTALGVPARVVG